MGLDFIQRYGGRRLDQYDPQPPLLDEPLDPENAEEQEDDSIELGCEREPDAWEPIDLSVPNSWQPRNWSDRPVRFIDGKDVGETIAWLRSPQGHPIPIRLSQIGGISMRAIEGECRREFDVVERIVSMEIDVFPWEEIESFAIALQQHGFRLLAAHPKEGLSYDFERMRKAAQNKSNEEMTALERVALEQGCDEPTIVDGRLEPRMRGAVSENVPVVGVIKTHWRNYLHTRGLQTKYQIEVEQRTPIFCLNECEAIAEGPNKRRGRSLSVVSWFVRLSGSSGASPNFGLVRVEIPKRWFEARGGFDHSSITRLSNSGREFIDQLSKTLYEYRCRERSYGRASISLHPIVRAEESLGTLFVPPRSITGRFYRLTRL